MLEAQDFRLFSSHSYLRSFSHVVSNTSTCVSSLWPPHSPYSHTPLPAWPSTGTANRNLKWTRPEQNSWFHNDPQASAYLSKQHYSLTKCSSKILAVILDSSLPRPPLPGEFFLQKMLNIYSLLSIPSAPILATVSSALDDRGQEPSNCPSCFCSGFLTFHFPTKQSQVSYLKWQPRGHQHHSPASHSLMASYLHSEYPLAWLRRVSVITHLLTSPTDLVLHGTLQTWNRPGLSTASAKRLSSLTITWPCLSI